MSCDDTLWLEELLGIPAPSRVTHDKLTPTLIRTCSNAGPLESKTCSLYDSTTMMLFSIDLPSQWKILPKGLLHKTILQYVQRLCLVDAWYDPLLNEERWSHCPMKRPSTHGSTLWPALPLFVFSCTWKGNNKHLYEKTSHEHLQQPRWLEKNHGAVQTSRPSPSEAAWSGLPWLRQRCPCVVEAPTTSSQHR